MYGRKRLEGEDDEEGNKEEEITRRGRQKIKISVPVWWKHEGHCIILSTIKYHFFCQKEK